MEGGVEWDADELRLLVVPDRGVGLRRRLGDTRRAFAERLLQRRRRHAAAARDATTTKTSSRVRKQRRQKQRQQQQQQLETASATTIIDNLTRKLRASGSAVLGKSNVE